MPGIHYDPTEPYIVQDFLKALAHNQGDTFFLIDPESRHRIFHVNLNIQVIGLSTQQPRPTNKPIGFQLPNQKKETPMSPDSGQDEETDNNLYDLEAVLVLRPDPALLPPKLQNTKTWVIEVVEGEDEQKFVVIAEALVLEYGVEIYFTSTSKNDSVPEHLEPEPVDKRFPSGIHYCRINPAKK